MTIIWGLESVPGLYSLPNELLAMIFELLYSREDKRPGGCMKFSTIWVLSRVSRRLRALAFPMLFREVEFEEALDFDNFPGLSSCLPEEGINVLSSVRSIRIWRDIQRSDFCFGTVHFAGDLPFFNLTEFDCTVYILGDGMLDATAHCPRLHTLAMTCGNSWPVTSLQRFPRLRTLRLATAMYDYTYGIPRMQDPISYTSITTLSLHNTSSFSTFISECLSWCTFPSLRVFSVQGFKSDERPYSNLFQFIHLHPTILEANIDTLEELRIRIESVLKLIDGTGTWVSGQGAEYLGNKVCKIDWLPGTWSSEIYPPDIVPNHPMLCQSFAFRRADLRPEAPLWSSPVGSPQPRYRCTSLDLHGLFDPFNPIHDGRDDNCKIELLRHLRVATPDLEELRIKAVQSAQDMEWMKELIKSPLPAFKRLRKLAIYWRCVPNEGALWERSYDAVDSLDYIPIIDDAESPLVMMTDGPKVLTIRDLREDTDGLSEDEIISVVDGVRMIFKLPPDEELDEDDATLLMRAWRDRNEAQAASFTRAIAEACPLLEEFDWYFQSDVFHGDEGNPLGSTCVLWSWKIHRNTNHQRPPISGTLRWLGCVQGDPPFFYPLVGQELKRALRLGSRAWTPLS